MTASETQPRTPVRHHRRGFLSSWDRHPAIPTGSDLTLGERSADRMRNTMGSWGFVLGFVLIMVLWAVANSEFYLFGQHGKHGFDPYPYILLNLMLSMIAGLQGAILLIAAKRSDQIASQLAEHDYETDTNAFKRIDEVHMRLAEVAEANRQLLEQNTAILERLATGSRDTKPGPT